jgi:hypothetical protein
MIKNVKKCEGADSDYATQITSSCLSRLSMLRDAFFTYSQSDCRDFTPAFWEGMSNMCTEIWCDLERLGEVFTCSSEKERIKSGTVLSKRAA